MTNPDEDQIVDELNREFTGKDNLIALVICFGLSGWVMAVTAFSAMTTG